MGPGGMVADTTHCPCHAGSETSMKGHAMEIAISTTLEHTAFSDALQRTRDALAASGFGVLTEIDMKATMRAKLGEDIEDYVILGACNPALAYRAVNIDRQIGLLLPCNVVVRRDASSQDTIHIEAMNPQLLVEVTGEDELKHVADEVGAKLQAALDTLTAGQNP